MKRFLWLVAILIAGSGLYYNEHRRCASDMACAIRDYVELHGDKEPETLATVAASYISVGQPLKQAVAMLQSQGFSPRLVLSPSGDSGQLYGAYTQGLCFLPCMEISIDASANNEVVTRVDVEVRFLGL